MDLNWFFYHQLDTHVARENTCGIVTDPTKARAYGNKDYLIHVRCNCAAAVDQNGAAYSNVEYMMAAPAMTFQSRTPSTEPCGTPSLTSWVHLRYQWTVAKKKQLLCISITSDLHNSCCPQNAIMFDIWWVKRVPYVHCNKSVVLLGTFFPTLTFESQTLGIYANP